MSDRPRSSTVEECPPHVQRNVDVNIPSQNSTLLEISGSVGPPGSSLTQDVANSSRLTNDPLSFESV